MQCVDWRPINLSKHNLTLHKSGNNTTIPNDTCRSCARQFTFVPMQPGVVHVATVNLFWITRFASIRLSDGRLPFIAYPRPTNYFSAFRMRRKRENLEIKIQKRKKKMNLNFDYYILFAVGAVGRSALPINIHRQQHQAQQTNEEVEKKIKIPSPWNAEFNIYWIFYCAALPAESFLNQKKDTFASSVLLLLCPFAFVLLFFALRHSNCCCCCTHTHTHNWLSGDFSVGFSFVSKHLIFRANGERHSNNKQIE